MAKSVWRIWGENLYWTANLATLLHWRNTYTYLLKKVRYSRRALLSMVYQRMLCFCFLFPCFSAFQCYPPLLSSFFSPIMAEIRKLLSVVLSSRPGRASDSQGEVSTNKRSERPHWNPLVHHIHRSPEGKRVRPLSNSSPALGDYNVTTDSRALINFTHWRQSISYPSTKETGPLVPTLFFSTE